MDAAEVPDDLLGGLTGAARQERAELVAWLLDRGFSAREIRDATSPVLLPAGRIVGDDGVLVSARQICEAAGIDLPLLLRLQQAVGLSRLEDPDAPVHLRADGAVAVRARQFLDLGFDEDQVVAVARILADGLFNAAEMMRFAVFSAVSQVGATELEAAQAYQALVEQTAPLLSPLTDDMLKLALRHSLESEAVNAAERAAGTPPGARRVAVAFADVVGFTRLGEEMSPEELERVADRLAELAREVAAGPVRFIKTIGDAVMLVSSDAAALLEAVLTLLDAAERADDVPPLRAGLAYGMAVTRAGDWFGSPVNLASRVTGAARPGSLLVAEQAREQLGDSDGVRWTFVGQKRLKNIKAETKLYRARRAE
ncbi:adenylate/guanylate cyclase domain-containing protein [Mycobacterium sp. MYCO198283]|uniref:adenylate/guanylate cyclase domain-containing protein n=1 Tax=Mycobacterium sp. MYCO198283 TaxID=2883505 RepID=UPI001E51AABE|nr:adenylate/guanylate cyclase domain-containing protein [Mycobacterium sp. MYCO198283]MCG5430736.1 adenylate/guanylate cyclase domain-containing protein [Mycobacterium sp. MYCO198283]